MRFYFLNWEPQVNLTQASDSSLDNEQSLNDTEQGKVPYVVRLVFTRVIRLYYPEDDSSTDIPYNTNLQHSGQQERDIGPSSFTYPTKSGNSEMHLPMFLIPLTMAMVIFLLFMIGLLLRPKFKTAGGGSGIPAIKTKKGMIPTKGLTYIGSRKPSTPPGMNSYMKYNPKNFLIPTADSDLEKNEHYQDKAEAVKTPGSIYTEITLTKNNPIFHV